MSRFTPTYDGQGPQEPRYQRWRVLWNRLRWRHDDGTEHVLVRDKDWDGRHMCDGDYCLHYQVKCTICGSTALHGDAVQEIR